MEAFLSNLASVASNVCVLFILMAVGFLANKLKIVNENGAKCLSDIALRIITPCVIVNSFMREYDPDAMKDYLIVLGVTLLVHGFLILCAHFTLFDKIEDRKKVYRFALIFSNAGYMAIPLQQAILGEEGVFFGSAYIAGFNIVLWSYGVMMMSADAKAFSIKKILLNQGIVAVAVGMLIFCLSVPIPAPVKSAVGHLAGMNTAVPMLVIGYYFADSDLKSALKDKKSYLCLFLRLVAAPDVAISVIRLCGMTGIPFLTMAIAISTPCAAATTMFSAKYNRDVHLSARLVSFSTALSVLTMPFVIAVSMLFA